ncbi:MAG TPA: PKD domain-containing protein [Phycisphaerae bacterium]|nr:PKD domain-containing protein [Phycisphaerae bacterium]
MKTNQMENLFAQVLVVLVAGCNPGAPVPTPSENHAPTVNLSQDQSVEVGASVTLDGSASSDPDGDELTFVWQQKLGTPVTLSASTDPIVNFIAPSNGTSLAFDLTVSDGNTNGMGRTTVSVIPTESMAQVEVIRQPSIKNDPAVSGNFPQGWASLEIPTGDQEVGKGGPAWLKQVVYAPTAEVELSPGAMHELELPIDGPSVLMGSVRWIGTTDALPVTLLLDGVSIATGDDYSIGHDRGGTDIRQTSTEGGTAVLSVTNSSTSTVTIRAMLGGYDL